MNARIWVAAALLVAAGLGGGAYLFLKDRGGAKQEGDPLRGKALAEQYCSRCHSTERGKESPVPDAPPFSTFAQRWPLENLEEALAEGIMVGHDKYQMPVFQFDPDQIADFIAYLRTIQEPAPKEPAANGAPLGGAPAQGGDTSGHP